ncbi:sensor histidine kinase [Streptococcus oricebi]|uniref:Sensor histidine kinase n=1 Tax=Streptococcus oricebi TaxID=1547447 RepID=A0ABS5B3N7_9STRE|nr:sensor histidine kinase [Streptococcus oricebi]MBP2623437.1 two-component sensor histidine kinase [Streptococcus oricebi]
MKKAHYFLLFFYTFLILGILIHYIFELFGFQWQAILGNLEKLEKFVFFVFFLGLSLTILMLLIIKFVQLVTVAGIQKNIKNILAGRNLQASNQPEIDRGLERLATRLTVMTENLQKSENQVLEREEEIIEKERRRIARDLHDTVSQELFAANLILSGLAGQVDRLDAQKISQQLAGIEGILNTAQKDLRILLLHLRPTELEGRSLVAGLEVILKELTDRSEIEINFQHQVGRLPKQIEEHIFRIAQEIISNTLRHAQANHLDVYLYQDQHELQLKMADDGLGFDYQKKDDLSYGLKNIEERVYDMAGSIQILTAPKQGVAIDIRVPLLEGLEAKS